MDKISKLKQYIFQTFKSSRENYSDEMYKKFSLYFQKTYEERIRKNIDNNFFIYSIVEELENLFKLSDLDIQKIITFDSSFEKMILIRKKILNLCIINVKKDLTRSVIKELDNYLQELNELQRKVLDFNKEEASKICADSFLDINYLKNKDVEIKSIELARMLD